MTPIWTGNEDSDLGARPASFVPNPGTFRRGKDSMWFKAVLVLEVVGLIVAFGWSLLHLAGVAK